MKVRPSSDFKSFSTDGSALHHAQRVDDFAVRQTVLTSEPVAPGANSPSKASCLSSACSMASAATLARPTLLVAEFGENLLRRLRLLGEHQLQVMTQRVLDGDDVIVRHADAVGQRADDRARLAQRGDGARR